MTEEIFREDAYVKSCEATVVSVDETGIELDRTVFYYESGGQPGDTGTLTTGDGRTVAIIDSRQDSTSKRQVHVPADDSPGLVSGDTVTATIDWDRRHRLMRMHSALHLLCAVVDAQITGAKVDAQKSRIDFDPENATIDKVEMQAAVSELIAADRPLAARWITDEELAAQPDLVRTMSVRPPTGIGQVRLMEIEGADLQPCGGTHVARTGEIGNMVIGKIENKGKRNRRVNVRLED